MKARVKKRGAFSNVYSVESPSRKKAVEEAKNFAVLAGANAITNMVCFIGIVNCTAGDILDCCINCTADAIQVD